MKSYARYICVALAIILAMIAPCAALAETFSAKVLTSSMEVYASPADSSATASLGQGTSFGVTGINGEWARITYKGHTGYARMSNIMFDNSIRAHAVRDTEILFVTKDSYSKRVSYRANVAAGTCVYVRGVSSGLLLVTNAEGSVLGFVHQADFVRG